MWIIIGIILFLGLATYIGMLLSGEDSEDATAAGLALGGGCLWIVAQIALSAAIVWILWSIGKWMFS